MNFLTSSLFSRRERDRERKMSKEPLERKKEKKENEED